MGKVIPFFEHHVDDRNAGNSKRMMKFWPFQAVPLISCQDICPAGFRQKSDPEPDRTIF